MPLDPKTASAVALAAAAVAVVALGLALLTQRRLARMRRGYAVLQGSGGRDDFVTAAGRMAGLVTGMRAEVDQLGKQVDDLRTDIHDAIRHVAVVRYDAFPDMGGRLSFSAALLDDVGDGIVLTSINGRSETRTYAKGVKAGRSEHPLTPEEHQAIGYATRAAPART